MQTVLKFTQAIGMFNSFCSMHYRYAVQLFKHYTLKKGNEFDADALISNGLSTVSTIHPAGLLSDYAPLLTAPHAPRLASALVETIYGLKSVTENMNEVWHPARREYDEAIKDYHENIHDLFRICDELREYTKGKPYNKTAGEWISGYFDIFDQWFRNGATRDIAVLQSAIIEKIFELNKQQPVHPFSGKTNEKALKCDVAFRKITDLDSLLCNKMLQYIWAFRKAARITGVINKHLVRSDHSDMPTAPLPALSGHKHGMSRKMLVALGVLLIIATGFAGGYYSGNIRQHDTSPDKPVVINKPVADTAKLTPKPLTRDTVAAPTPNRFDSIAVVSGLDISRYQGNLLRDVIHLDSLHFIICKATQGVNWIDPEFSYNWKRIKDLDMIRGAYHFYKAEHDPVKQAAHFVKTVGPLADTDIPLVLDIEDGSLQNVSDTDSLQNHLLVFLQHVEDHTRKKPVIYTSLYFANKYLTDPAFGHFPLWIAEYSRKFRTPILPKTWKNKGHVIWQKDDSFTFQSSKVDFDVFNGNGTAFLKFLNGR